MVLVIELGVEVNVKFKQSGKMLRSKGLRLDRSKTEYLWTNFSGENNKDDVTICIIEDRVSKIHCFKYLDYKIPYKYKLL